MAQWLLLFQSIQVQFPAPMSSGLQLSLTSPYNLTHTHVCGTPMETHTHTCGTPTETHTRVSHPQRHIHVCGTPMKTHIHVCGTPRETHTYVCGMLTKIHTHMCGTPKDSLIHINKNLKPFSSLPEAIFTLSKVFKLASVETNSAWGSSFMY